MTFTVCQSGEREVLGVPYWIGALSLAAARGATPRGGGGPPPAQKKENQTGGRPGGETPPAGRLYADAVSAGRQRMDSPSRYACSSSGLPAMSPAFMLPPASTWPRSCQRRCSIRWR